MAQFAAQPEGTATDPRHCGRGFSRDRIAAEAPPTELPRNAVPCLATVPSITTSTCRPSRPRAG
ncbi:hypothetical protein DZC76_05310 [Pseudomonas sp. phDV1]|nr:hypothetical protein DZC76_05310 [Pseudomonas sp. phDV1]PPV41240.1 hypothetical protein C5L43_08000 [Pseudomonas oleovorans]PZP76910.1 MAG: hypothetical protein DI578_19485 [Pseudomonas oleovorans]PZQ41339.1 MAG: hypothetical protein DI559_06930 [Pseudomonas oleovorans]